MTIASVPSVILREPALFWSELKAGQALREKTYSLVAITCLFFAVYGGIMGAFNSPLQALSSAIKLPLLYLGTMLICVPTLHILNLLFGARQSLSQVLVLLLATLAVTATILAAFAPVTAFFMMTTRNYEFIKLLNVAIIAISGVIGIRFFYRGMHAMSDDDKPSAVAAREKVLRAWILLYAFVGSQLAWTLRPFFGDPHKPFEIVREVGGNFYTDVGHTLKGLLTTDR